MKHIAILASGSGTNAENIIRYFDQHPKLRVSLVLCNRKEAGVYERAERLGVPCMYIPKAGWQEEEKVLALLQQYKVEALVLAGFLLLVPEWLIQAYPDQMLNIHPALLPAYGGKGMYGANVHEAVLSNQDARSGITIHVVNEHYDEGRILAQFTCPVRHDDNPETLAARIHELEYRHYPVIIENYLQKPL
jgi:phosphoribosylglycinamide formyltransferase-1